MPTPPKYILHCPLIDSARLENFIESCLAEKASLIAIVGSDSAELEDTIDEILVRMGKCDNITICTTSHPNESFEEVLSFVTVFNADEGGTINEVRF
jgi:hypothetical protein